jgi:nicotinamidase/pyrazinamidase
MIVTKGTTPESQGYSSFEGTVAGRGWFADELDARGVTHLLVGGLATDYCVRASVLDALGRGYDVTVIEDAVRAVNLTPDAGTRAIEEMRAAGAAVLPSVEVEWVE